MPKEIYLIKVGMTMTEGMVAEWHVADGDQVQQGDLVYTLETEKVSVDVDAESAGQVRRLVEVGVMLEPGALVGYIYEAGEEIPQDLDAGAEGAQQIAGGARDDPLPTVALSQARAPAAAGPAASRGPGERVLASPAARRLASELGIDYRQLRGTGPGGRLVEADVQAAHARGGQSAAAVKASPLARRLAEVRGIDLSRLQGTGPGGRIVQADLDTAARPASAPAGSSGPTVPGPGSRRPLTGMRRTIAQRMKQSLETSAQLTMNMGADMGEAEKLRASLIAEWEAEKIRPTYTDLVLKAVAKALHRHPMMNSRLDESSLVVEEEINLGIAVALPEGLVVPVIHDALGKPLKEIARESAGLAVAAREGRLGLDDFAGGTFTVSSLGMYGVDTFTPIINQPQAGILGVNRVADGLVWEGEKPIRARQMNLSLTWDHRILDGAPAAEFLAEVAALLGSPYRLLV